MKPVNTKLRILHIEDSANDAELVHVRLAEEGFESDVMRTDREDEVRKLLDTHTFDVVLCDYSIPGFDGLAALSMIRNLDTEIPFIFVSGTIGEGRAIEALKHGATDYVIKGDLTRLAPSIRRAMRESAERTRRKTAEESMRTSEEKYRGIFENAVEGMFRSLPTGGFVDVNPAYARILGYTSPRELVDAISDIRTQLYLDPAVRDGMQKELELDGVIHGAEVQLRRKDGGSIWVAESIRIVYGKNGEVVCYEGTSEDISERKRLETQLLRNQRLESIGTLASGIALDLNNVLGPIILGVDILRQRYTDPEGQKMLMRIDQSAKRGAMIVRQVLTFARGEEGERTLLGPQELIEEVMSIAEETFPKSISITEDVEIDSSLISGNATQLHQVLLNLCVNARDAMPSGGKLNIDARNVTLEDEYIRYKPGATKGRYVVISVADTGTGIPPQVLDRIFDPFFTTKSVGKGTGLGLASSLGIVKNHGGFIDVYSEVGAGSRFGVYLPVAEGSPKVEEPSLEPLATGHGETILVIDDELSIREIAKASLEANGYNVTIAENGAEGIRKFKEDRAGVRLVLTDVSMPVLDGLSVIRELERIDPGVRIIAMSGLSHSAEVAPPDSRTVRGFLAKPYTVRQLLGKVSEILNSSPRR